MIEEKRYKWGSGLGASKETASGLGEEQTQIGTTSESTTAINKLQGGKQCQRELSRPPLEERLGKLSGEERILLPALSPRHETPASLLLMAPTTASRYTAIWLVAQCPSDLMGFMGGCTQMMQILVDFQPLRDPTKFQRYFLPKVLFFCKAFFWQVDFIFQLLSLYRCSFIFCFLD